ncbi:PREDICTED: uncharacterized protein LOC105312781 [Amphimedon queenslandica]|uniref:NACHT domain-containing protein n=1 Tax=Amphimedon queenslandica TaxID=400682 RepID=A0AAN0J5R4_AMPQE|nr:PREDICTED: uncharacterized protein LOC105312781 [Amphimedon queenslandica]|eukprot:XP_019852051.1 PREDICTED: uncharacterized protein LOC105312781 [Amphimedon queenslandica]
MTSIAAKTIRLNIKHLKVVLSNLKQFSKTEWETFGLECGLHYNTLEAIQANNAGKPGSVEKCFRDTVTCWLKKKDNVDGKGEPTLERLADIVEETGDKATAEEIRNQFRKDDNEITEPIPTIPDQCSTSLWWIVTPVLVLVAIIIYISLRATVIDEYAIKLCDEYAEKLTRYRDPDINKVPAAGPSAPIYVSFVPLKLIRLERHGKEDAGFLKTASIEEILEKYERIEIDDILKPLADKRLRFVLIEGEPGIGKSTLAKELTLRWVRNTDKLLNNFKIVIFVTLRLEIYQKAKTFENLLINFDDINMTEIALSIKKTRGAGVLWILDGFDELPHQLRNSSTSLFIKFIKGDILPKSTVIVTSRLAASLPLYNNLEHDSKSLYLLGFSPNETREYATKYFENNKTLADEFHSYYSHDTMIEIMLYNPMTCFIMCTVFNDFILSNDKGYPITMTGIYNHYVRILLKRHLIDNNKAIDINYDMPQLLICSIDFNSPELNSTWKQFYYLSKVAYNGVMKQQYAFGKELHDVPKLSMMDTINSFSGFYKDESSSFIHTTLQEYFAAIYLVNNPDSMFTKEDLEHNSNLEVVLTFYVGLLKFIDREVDNKTIDMILKQDRYYRLDLNDNFQVFGLTQYYSELSSLILRCLYEQDSLLSSKHFLDKKYVMSYFYARRSHFEFFFIVILNTLFVVISLLLIILHSQLNLQGYLK